MVLMIGGMFAVAVANTDDVVAVAAVAVANTGAAVAVVVVV